MGPALLPATLGTGDYGMERFQDCDAMRDWTTDAWVEVLVQSVYGGGGPIVMYETEDADVGMGGEGRYSETNVQEAGVDEPDVVETDGEHLYVVRTNDLAILDAVPPEDLAIVGTQRASGYALGFFLGDQASTGGATTSGGARGVLFSVPGNNGIWTRAEILDLSDPAAPRVDYRVDVEGSWLDARRIGDDVYFIVATYLSPPEEVWALTQTVDLPDWDPSAGPQDRAAAMFAARRTLRPYVAAIVADLDDVELVPSMRVAGRNEPLLTCDAIYRPGSPGASQLLSIVHVDLAGDGPATATGVYADGWTVYASADHLYVSSSGGGEWWWGSPTTSTRIHRFALDGQATTYEGSASVPGWLLGRYAMDEEDGILRVATTEVDEAGTTSSGLFTFEMGVAGLRELGEVRGIAPGETMYAARFIGDAAYLVTYLQVDPLFTVDLTDPSAPFVAGELKVPGWSSYLHPYGADELVAVGMSGAEPGVVTDLSLSLFDVSDLAAPALVDQLPVGTGGSWSEALWDPHAFLLYGDTIAMPVYAWEGEKAWSGLGVYGVDPVAGFTFLGRIEHGDLSPACADDPTVCNAVAWMRRSVVIGDTLYSVSDLGVKASSLADPSVELGRVAFTSASNPTR